MGDMPALKLDAQDVDVQALINQLRAMASGMESALDVPDLRVSYSVEVRFHRG